jgi:hypothetical protein
MTSLHGGEVVLTSPDHARTFAFGEMVCHQLYVDPTNRELAARITFSNLPYAGDREPRVDEPFNFRFPGTHVDLATRTIVVRARHGRQITVARFQGDPTNGRVDLEPGAKVYLLKESGHVTAVLTATNEPRAGMRWIQMDDNCSLQNLLAGVWRDARSGLR